MKKTILIICLTLSATISFGQVIPLKYYDFLKKADSKFNLPLIFALDSIVDDDQKYRSQIEDIQKKYGYESIEMRTLGRLMNEKDSINRIKVEAFLDKYGWLGADVIGKKGNAALFFVIQHSGQATQEKYLPMMRDATKKGNAEPSHLALLEDKTENI